MTKKNKILTDEKFISVSISDIDLWNKITALANKEHRSRSNLVECILRGYLELGGAKGEK